MIYIGLALLILGASPYPIWQNVYDWGNTDRAYGSVLTSADSLIVSGESNSQGDFDCVLLNLSLKGDTFWTIFYDDDHGDESGRDVDVDSAGNIYVACASDWEDWPSGGSGDILKYSPSCQLIWTRGAYGNLSERVIVGHENHIFLGVRYGAPGGVGARIVAYDTLGSVLWREFFQPPGDVRPTGVALSSDNSIWMSALWPCVLVGWESDGTPTFYVIYEEDSARGQAVEIDQGDNIFIAGDLSIDSQRDFMLLKYLLNGFQVWPEAKVYDLGHNEYCSDIALDSIVDCYLAGWQERGMERDAALVKTDSAGNMLWAWVDTLEGNQEIEGIEVDEDGYIYLAGSHHNGENWDMLVMKIAQPLTITGRVTDSTGAPMEGIPVSLTGDTTVEVLTDTEGYYTIEVYNGGEYTVSPNLPGWSFTPSTRTYAPLAHREWDQDFEGRWTGVEESSPPIVFDLQVVENRILYQVPYQTHVKIGVYDIAGRLVLEVVDDEVKPGRHCFEWKGCDYASRTVASGIYFVKMMTDDYKKTVKMVILE